MKEKVRKGCVVCYILIDNCLLFIRGERKDKVDVMLVCGGRRVIVGCCRHKFVKFFEECRKVIASSEYSWGFVNF